MSKKKEVQSGRPEPDSLASKLAALRGSGGGLNIDELDGTVLWLAVTALARRRASLSLGVTKDGGSWVCQLWDGSYPVKDYYRDTSELNRGLAGLVRASEGNSVSPEVEEILQGYGW